MYKSISVIFILITSSIFGQKKTPEDFGFRHFVYQYTADSVDILVKSKKGEELKRKPILLFCQGSLPVSVPKKQTV